MAGVLGAGNVCSYDACAKDTDCGSADICDCRNSAASGANLCFHGNCRGAGAFCSPSATDLTFNCRMGVDPGAYGFFCHTPADECVDDADCGGSALEHRCLFGVSVGHWACVATQCTR
jgi:hypothetical protein